jgi:hypothetical protein
VVALGSGHTCFLNVHPCKGGTPRLPTLDVDQVGLDDSGPRRFRGTRLPRVRGSPENRTVPRGLLHPRGPPTVATPATAGLNSIVPLPPGDFTPSPPPGLTGVSPKSPHTTRKAGGVSRG